MPKTLTLRNVPDDVVRQLRGRAQRNGRSMQLELLSLVCQATVDRRSLERQLERIRSTRPRRLTSTEIHRAIDEGRP